MPKKTKIKLTEGMSVKIQKTGGSKGAANPLEAMTTRAADGGLQLFCPHGACEIDLEDAHTVRRIAFSRDSDGDLVITLHEE
jgi:hypothetical protein